MNERDVLFCPFCGAKMGKDEKICMSCGRENNLGSITAEDLFPPAPDRPPTGYQPNKNPYENPRPNRGYETSNRQSQNPNRTVGSICGCILCIIVNIIWLFL